MLNATVGDETTIENSVLLHCSVGSHTTVGPFAYLRPKAAVGNHCRIGDFVEIKNSNIGDETKVSHLTYVGDGDLGQHINLGCGVVFSNYDGKLKHRTVVEDNAFIGCNVNLVPPVHIGKDTYIAAGSTVTQDVPDDALFIARVRGEIKEGWSPAARKRGNCKTMHLIVGLGNPGDQYAHTRHNVGFDVLSILADKLHITTAKHKGDSQIMETFIGNEKVVLCKPQTFMNLSGKAVSELIHFYKLPLDNLLIIYDDIDIPQGWLRIRRGGSAGTHNACARYLPVWIPEIFRASASGSAQGP